MDDLDVLLAGIGRRKTLPIASAADSNKFLSVTGFKALAPEWGSMFRLWEQDMPWQGAAQESRAVHIDKFADSAEPIAVLRSDFMLSLSSTEERVRLWQEPAPRKLQQCIMHITDDSAEREQTKVAGLIWLPVLNHRLGGEVKGIVVHRVLNGLTNEMSPSPEQVTLAMYDPTGTIHRHGPVQAGALLSPFSFAIGSEARTGTWKLELRNEGTLYDEVSFEVLAFTKPDVMLVDHTAWSRVPRKTAGSVRVAAKYFFDEPVCEGTVTYAISPADPLVPPFKGFDPDWKSKDGTFEFPALTDAPGAYQWEVTVTDVDGRSGSVSGAYTVVTPSVGLACAFAVKSAAAVAEDVSENFSVIYPALSTISVSVAVENELQEAVPHCRFVLEMEGQGEYWRFLEPAPQDTGKDGRVTLQIAFNEVAFESAEPFVMVVSAAHNGARLVWRKVILVDPRNQFTVKFDRESYRPGDEVIVSVTYKRAAGDAATEPCRVAADMVGQTVWAADTLLFDAQARTVQYKTVAPVTREPIHLHLRAALSAPVARFRVPIDVPGFYTDKLSVVAPPKVATGAEIPIKITLPQAAETDGVVVAMLVDKRIKKHPERDNADRWTKRFYVDPVTKQEHCTAFYEVREWEHCKEAVRFQGMLCSVQWIGFAFLNPEQRGRVLLVALQDTSKLTPSRVQFFKTLLSHDKSLADTVAMAEGFPGLEQAALFDVGATVKTLTQPAMYNAPGVVAVPSYSLRKALKGQLSFLTNNLIATPPKNKSYRKAKAAEKLRELLDSVEALKRMAMAPDKDVADDYYTATVVRQDFIEVAFVSSAFSKGATELNLAFSGTDAITTYDVFVFACTEGQIAYGKNQTVVKNKYFTVTKNPAQMVLADKSMMRTIIQNTGDAPMENVLLQLSLSRLRCALAEQTVAKVEPGASASVVWDIIADGVGDAKMELLMKSGAFTEISGFDTPLTVIPPGEPVVQTHKGLVDKLTSWKMNFACDPDAAYVKVVGSILPCVPLSGAVEGVECLASYPYGCCEQMHSSTLPNYVLYTYLVRTGSTNQALMDKCLKQLAVGCEGIIDKYRCEDGGFGAWGRGESTLFHTGLILSLLGLASTVVAIDQSAINAAASRLSESCATSGEMKPRTKHWPEARWDSITTTAHVFNSLCLAGCKAAATLAWLKGNLLHRCDDTAAVALVLEGLTRLAPDERAPYVVFMRNLRRLLLLEQRDDGSWASSGSSLCRYSSDVEATSYVIIALARSLALEKSAEIASATHETTTALAKGLDYVIAHHKGKGGWGSTRDTLYAAWAVAEASGVVWSRQADSSYCVRLNGQVVHKWAFKADATDDDAVNTLCGMREFVLPAELLRKTGEQEVVIESTDGRASAALEVHTYFHADNVDSSIAFGERVGAPVRSLGLLNVHWPAATVTRGRAVKLGVYLTPNDEYTAVMLEVPIPAGMLLASIDSIDVSPKANVTKEFNPKLKTLSIFFHSVSSGHPISVIVTLEPFINGQITANPCRAYLMYDPQVVATSSITKLAIV